jgi:hypothetical protein
LERRGALPNWAPPFAEFFAEWNEPQVWNFGDGQHALKNDDLQVGFLVRSVRVPPETRGQTEAWEKTFEQILNSRWEGFKEQLRKHLGNTGWFVIASEWMARGAPPICGSPLYVGLIYFLFVSDDGRCVVVGDWYEEERTEDVPWYIRADEQE